VRKCHRCDGVNTEAAAFCAFCGGSLSPALISAASPVAPDVGGFCPQCGAPIVSGSHFCDLCGRQFSTSSGVVPLPPMTPPPVVSGISSGKTRKWLGLAIGAVIVAGGVGGVLLYGNGPPVPADSSNLVKNPSEATENRAQAFEAYTRALESVEKLERDEGDASLLRDAFDDAEKATRLDPTVASYWHLLGYAYARLRGDKKSLAKAEEALDNAVAIDPDSIAPRLLLVHVLLERSSHAQAATQLEWLGRKDPAVLDASVLREMGRVYLSGQMEERGEAYFLEILKVNPNATQVRLALAVLLQARDKTDLALTYLTPLLGGDSTATTADVSYARELHRAWSRP